MASTQSTITLQQIADKMASIVDIAEILSVSGFSNTTMLTIAQDVMNEYCAQRFPWKWNELQLPVFYTTSWQQDYALQLTNLASLQRGIAFNMSVNTVPKPWTYVLVVREQEAETGAWWFGTCPFFPNPVFEANWMLNSNLYYGTWGGSNEDSTLGNNPVAGSVYTNPIGAAQQPNNPITQIKDTNGNFLLLTTYGTTGNSAPSAAPNASPGTTVADGTCVWTVVDPNGQGIRITPVPSQTGAAWQFRLIGQMKPVIFTSLGNTLFPMPDSFESQFRQGCVAQAYRYSAIAKVREKFAPEWALWQKSLLNSREKSDKERDANRFVPRRSVLGAGGSGSSYVGPAYPWNGGNWQR